MRYLSTKSDTGASHRLKENYMVSSPAMVSSPTTQCSWVNSKLAAMYEISENAKHDLLRIVFVNSFQKVYSVLQ